MTVLQRSRGRVETDRRSVVPTVGGLPWWAVIATALAPILLGVLIDSARGTELTRVYGVLYTLGCLAAVLVAQNRALFTAMVQPPLLMVVVVPLTYWGYTDGPLGGFKGAVLDLGLPLINRFPTMAITAVVVWVIGAIRLVNYLQDRRAVRAPRPAMPATRRPGARDSVDATGTAGRAKDAPRRERPARPRRPRPAPTADDGPQTVDRPAGERSRDKRAASSRARREDVSPERRTDQASAQPSRRPARPTAGEAGATPRRPRPESSGAGGQTAPQRPSAPREPAADPRPATPPRPRPSSAPDSAAMPHLPNVRYRD